MDTLIVQRLASSSSPMASAIARRIHSLSSYAQQLPAEGDQPAPHVLAAARAQHAAAAERQRQQMAPSMLPNDAPRFGAKL